MDLNLTTVALALFVILAGFVLLRGALRILLGTIVLSGSAWIAFRAWQLAPTLSEQYLGKPLDWLSYALPAVAFLVTFLIGRLLVKFLASPFQKNEGERKPVTLPRLVGAGIFSLIPTAILGTIATVFINHAGVIDKLKTAGGNEPAESRSSSLLKSLSDSIEKSIPAAWLKLLDPLADPDRVSLAQQIARKSPPKPVIDPSTGKPIPRAIIVDDPTLNTLAKRGDYADLLRSPKLTEALNDPKVQKAIRNFARQ
ncbi:MAG: CvpA family protein [Luteolibacter sp.]